MGHRPEVGQELDLPFSASSVPRARQFVGTELRTVVRDPSLVEDAVLIVSELASNAIRHAWPLPGGRMTVTYTCDADYVEVGITDGGGPTRPRVSRGSIAALGGRGLPIVDELACHWGVRTAGPSHGNAGAVTVYARVARGRYPRR